MGKYLSVLTLIAAMGIVNGTRKSIPPETQTYMLYFTAKWCKPCQEMRPQLVILKESGWNIGYLGNWEPVILENGFHVAPIIMVDVNEYPDLMQKYDIQKIPCGVKIEAGKMVRKKMFNAKTKFIEITDFYSNLNQPKN